jgi:hypothetical protein
LRTIDNSLQNPSADRSEWHLADASSSLSVISDQRGWIQSRFYDLCLFTLSPLAGLVVIWAALGSAKGTYLIVLATYLVAIPHYVSSFSFYLGDENLTYYRTRWFAFFAGPAIILLAVIALRVLKVDAIVQSTMYVWNVYHVSLQSAGILSIYRRLNGGLIAEKPFAHASILGVSATMAFWHVERFAPLYGLLQEIHFPVWTIRPAFLGFALIALVLYFERLRRRPKRVSSAEIGFLLSAFLFFHPYLWVRDINLATFGMLMGHFLQYLGMVWLLNRRKYADAEGSEDHSEHQRILSAVSKRSPLLVVSLASIGLVFYLAQKGSAWLGVPLTYVILWNSLTLVHFYLDGLVWAFKDPFVRRSVGPYLTPQSHMVVP